MRGIVGWRKAFPMTPTRTSATDPRYSRYLRARQKGNWIAVFHELHPQPRHLPTSTWQKLHDNVGSLPPLIAGELRERGLLVTSPADDDAAWAAAHRELTTRPGLALITGKDFARRQTEADPAASS
jgi:hypothetical protein